MYFRVWTYKNNLQDQVYKNNYIAEIISFEVLTKEMTDDVPFIEKMMTGEAV